MRKVLTVLVVSLGVLALGLTIWAAGRGRAGGRGERQAELVGERQAEVVDTRDNYFAPAVLTVRPGQRVRWVNRGQVAHTATSLDGLWDSKTLAPGGSYTVRFRRAGTYRYLCLLHPLQGMYGTIVVDERG